MHFVIANVRVRYLVLFRSVLLQNLGINLGMRQRWYGRRRRKEEEEVNCSEIATLDKNLKKKSLCGRIFLRLSLCNVYYNYTGERLEG